MKHPFAELLEIKWESSENGESLYSIDLSEKHMNPHNVAHGGVLSSIADTGMGSALYTLLDQGESCATIEIKVSFFRPAGKGKMTCKTKIVYKGKRTANLESELFSNEKMIAKATGTFAIFNIERYNKNKSE